MIKLHIYLGAGEVQEIKEPAYIPNIGEYCTIHTDKTGNKMLVIEKSVHYNIGSDLITIYIYLKDN